VAIGALEDLNVPAGPSGQVKIPSFDPTQLRNLRKLDLISPAHLGSGLVREALEGNLPVEMRPFGPVLTTRGAVGLSLDILQSPSQWYSFDSL